MLGQHIRARQVVATIAVVTMGFLVANSGANAGTKLMRTPDGDSCAQADSAPPQSLPAVIEACDVVVTQAQGDNLGRFHRYRGRALQKSAELTRARSDFDQALAILPNDEWSLKWRAAVREALGDNGGAIEDYRRLNALQPNISDWRRAIARLGGPVEPPPKSAEPPLENAIAENSPPASSEETSSPESKQSQAMTGNTSQARQQSPPVPADAAKASGGTDSLEAVLDDILGQPDGGNAASDTERKAAEEQQAREADRIELVRRAQTELKRLGYDIGEVDGVTGPRTRNSLRDWLQRSGQSTGRELDAPLVAELERAQVPAKLEMAEVETKGLEPETGAGAKASGAAPQESAKEQVQEPPKGPMIAATGPLDRVPAAAVTLPESPKQPPAASLIPPRTDGEKRVALVIGNSNYRNVAQLRNPRQDAEDMTAALEEMGFKVFPGYDLDRDAMDDLTTEFAREAANADLALTYYSGHALQYAGANLLVPVDGQLQDQYSLRRLIRLDQLIQDTGEARKLAVVIVDACRDDPLAGRQSATRSLAIPKGLAQPGYIPPQDRRRLRDLSWNGRLRRQWTQQPLRFGAAPSHQDTGLESPGHVRGRDRRRCPRNFRRAAAWHLQLAGFRGGLPCAQYSRSQRHRPDAVDARRGAGDRAVAELARLLVRRCRRRGVTLSCSKLCIARKAPCPPIPPTW